MRNGLSMTLRLKLMRHDIRHLSGRYCGHTVIMTKGALSLEAWATRDMMPNDLMARAQWTCENMLRTAEDGHRRHSQSSSQVHRASIVGQ